MTPIPIAALTIATLAAITDLRLRQIPNWLTLTGLALGLALHLQQATFRDSFQGALLAFAIHLPLFALRWTSGGDVKLMTALGAIVGLRHWLTIFVFSSILGGVAAVYLVWRHKRLKQTAVNIGAMMQGKANLAQPGALTLPRGPIAAIAVVLWVLIS